MARLIQTWREMAGVEVEFEAVDVPEGAAAHLPERQTTTILRDTPFERWTNASLKRNVGLAVAQMAGWQRMVFLDDDIRVPDATDLRRAAGLLTEFDCAGLTIGGFPDNSVVCHAHRDAGGDQDTFVGSGALAVSRRRFTSFFPRIYNEDWFYMLDEDGLPRIALSGHALQEPYDPFGDPDRAGRQEFGDLLGEGIFSLLDQGGKIGDATASFWRGFLAKRQAFITDIVDRLSRMTMEESQRACMVAALTAAYEQCRLITPDLCRRYLDAWRADRLSWHDYVDGLPGNDVRGALRALHLGAGHSR